MALKKSSNSSVSIDGETSSECTRPWSSGRMSSVNIKMVMAHRPVYFWKSGLDAWNRILTLSRGATAVFACEEVWDGCIWRSRIQHSRRILRVLQKFQSEPRRQDHGCLVALYSSIDRAELGVLGEHQFQGIPTVTHQDDQHGEPWSSLTPTLNDLPWFSWPTLTPGPMVMTSSLSVTQQWLWPGSALAQWWRYPAPVTHHTPDRLHTEQSHVVRGLRPTSRYTDSRQRATEQASPTWHGESAQPKLIQEDTCSEPRYDHYVEKAYQPYDLVTWPSISPHKIGRKSY